MHSTRLQEIVMFKNAFEVMKVTLRERKCGMLEDNSYRQRKRDVDKVMNLLLIFRSRGREKTAIK